ncbi:MAG TPA: nucleotidyl transferase AbiEii/AbiGii toxin family protein [Puia sp.]|jgi:predicted nucleotidyltransferase component of viral defense system|nr:nucleotidyl transferase AbiEii/AbiGii toxin family protein [Puia sp.]
MISKAEILSVAKANTLLASTVEKDYVLSWVLYGISKNSVLSEWIFKGGTCLKKCYFETYRFSEDLDFTVPPGAAYEQDAIKAALKEVALLLYSETGIDIKVDSIEVAESINTNQARTFEAKISYIGPLNYTARTLPRIKFDITNDEIIADEQVMKEVFHNYTDAPVPPANVRCYSINEILAEKTRALFQRQGRARDVYDIVNIGRNFREDVDVLKARSALKEKFKFKMLPDPNVLLIIESINFELLKGNWNDQLSHQLPVLPPVEGFFKELQTVLSWWMEEMYDIPLLSKISSSNEELTEPRVHFPEGIGLYHRRLGVGDRINVSSNATAGSVLDQIRYAARNRLCISFDYKGTKRVAEPYSLRRPRAGNLLLYVFERSKDGFWSESIKAFKVNSIEKVEILQQDFTPRYAVEL